MNEIQVNRADDDGDVDALLAEWKGKAQGGERYRYLLARLNGEAVGVLEGHHDWANWSLLADWHYLAADGDARGSFVTALFVAPDARRHGVGAALMGGFEREARDNGRPVIVAWPDEDDNGRESRLSFFTAIGFGFAPYPGNAREPWLMTKELR